MVPDPKNSLTKMTDARNNSTQYSYEATTDRLTGVSATASGQTRKVSYMTRETESKQLRMEKQLTHLIKR